MQFYKLSGIIDIRCYCLKWIIEMNKTKIIIGINVVFIILIIMAFLPALKSGDEGYKTKTFATQEGIDTAPVDVAVTEQSAPLVTMEEDKVEQAIVATESVVNEADTTVEETIAAVETAVIEQPIIPPTEAVMATVESTTTAAAVEGLYSVVDGNKLDASSYAGFKLFRNWCARCHGTYGQGMVGPNLADSLKIISKEQFYDTVENGKSGRIGSMPSWKANIQVMANIDQLYAYLKARSDGAIGVEKPQKQ
jgi:mono/diheme cytochrome c family protein